MSQHVVGTQFHFNDVAKYVRARHRQPLGFVMGTLSCDSFPRSLPALLLLLFCLFGPSAASELSFVTCGSVIKLLNIQHNVRLHSHDVRYGSGEFALVKTHTHTNSGCPASAKAVKTNGRI